MLIWTLQEPFMSQIVLSPLKAKRPVKPGRKGNQETKRPYILDIYPKLRVEHGKGGMSRILDEDTPITRWYEYEANAWAYVYKNIYRY